MYLSTMYCMNVIWVFLPEINVTYLLTYILDKPHIPGYTASRKADTNSLLDMAQVAAPILTWEVGDIEKSTNRGGHP